MMHNCASKSRWIFAVMILQLTMHGSVIYCVNQQHDNGKLIDETSSGIWDAWSDRTKNAHQLDLHCVGYNFPWDRPGSLGDSKAGPCGPLLNMRLNGWLGGLEWDVEVTLFVQLLFYLISWFYSMIPVKKK